MRILHVITSLKTGGAEKLMVDLLPRLREKGHEVELCLFDGVETPFKQQLADQGVRIHDFGTNRSVYHPANLKSLRHLIKTGGYDIIHSHNTSPQLFSAIAAIGSKVKLVTTEHNTSNRRRNIPVLKVGDKWMYNRYKKIICISRKAEENLQKYLGSCGADILTITNGVNTREFANAQPSSELESLAPGSRKIIMVAAFRPQKDQDTLIRAMAHLPENFHLFLAGGGERHDELKQVTADEGMDSRVHFLGLRTDVAQLLHAADYVVMSSHYEGLSLSSVEGMCVGKPFLASDVDGLHEVVEGAGILFPHQNAEELARQILTLEASENQYNKIASACGLRAAQFDISTMASEYSKLYNSL